MLGTGNAHATRCYNTCFTLHSSGGSVLLVDAGGGNGILSQLEKVGLGFEDIQDIFVTHAHTDHMLGVVWLIRMIWNGLIYRLIYSFHFDGSGTKPYLQSGCNAEALALLWF